jgi:hypothetical protein
MSQIQSQEERFDDMAFKHGETKGRLVAVMDLLSDAQIKIGTHSAYCKSPAPLGRPSQDIEDVMSDLTRAKRLIATLVHK